MQSEYHGQGDSWTDDSLLHLRDAKHSDGLSAPDDIDPDTMLPIETHGKSPEAMPTEKLDHNSNVDLYLRLLIEADEELAKDSTVDQMSPSYNIQLNNRIAERLESLGKGNNK